MRVLQPCRQCGAETFCDAYIRYGRKNKRKVLCRKCAITHDRHDRSVSDDEFLTRWDLVPKNTTLEGIKELYAMGDITKEEMREMKERLINA